MNKDLNPTGAASHSGVNNGAAALGALTFSEDHRGGCIAQALVEHPLVLEALARLGKELPGGLAYHNYQHTMDVFYRSIELAVNDQLSDRDVTLIAIAAAWHDTGFIVQSSRNEPIAAQWAREAMTRAGGFSESEIRDVEVAILDTQITFDSEINALVQRCTGRLAPWLLDADLANFGQRNFMEKSAQVYAEMTGRAITSAADFIDDAGRRYVATTLRMLAAHHWHSQAATAKLSSQETKNRALLGHLFAELHGGTEAGLQRAWISLRGNHS